MTTQNQDGDIDLTKKNEADREHIAIDVVAPTNNEQTSKEVKAGTVLGDVEIAERKIEITAELRQEIETMVERKLIEMKQYFIEHNVPEFADALPKAGEFNLSDDSIREIIRAQDEGFDNFLVMPDVVTQSNLTFELFTGLSPITGMSRESETMHGCNIQSASEKDGYNNRFTTYGRPADKPYLFFYPTQPPEWTKGKHPNEILRKFHEENHQGFGLVEDAIRKEKSKFEGDREELWAGKFVLDNRFSSEDQESAIDREWMESVCRHNYRDIDGDREVSVPFWNWLPKGSKMEGYETTAIPSIVVLLDNKN